MKNFYLNINKINDMEEKTPIEKHAVVTRPSVWRDIKRLVTLTGRNYLLPDYQKSSLASLIIRRTELQDIFSSLSIEEKKDNELSNLSRNELWKIYKDLGLPKISYKSATKKVLIEAILKFTKTSRFDNKYNDELSNTHEMKDRINSFNELISTDGFDRYKLTETGRNLIISLFQDIANSKDKYALRFSYRDTDRTSLINEQYYLKAVEWVIQDAIDEKQDEFGSDQLTEIEYGEVTNLRIEKLPQPVRLLQREQKGNFFQYYNLTNIDLSQEEIYTKQQFLDLGEMENCFISVLIKSGFFTEDHINKIKIDFVCSTFSKSHILAISKEYNVTFRLYEVDKNQIDDRYIGNKNNTNIIKLNLYKGHYFIYRELPYTLCYINNYNELKDKGEKYHMAYRKMVNKSGKNKYSYKETTVSNLRLIREMFDNNLFTQDGEFLSHSKFQAVTDVYSLNNIANEQQKLEKSSRNSTEVKLVFYADIETDTTKGRHIPVMTQITSDSLAEIKVYTGPLCVENMFNYIDTVVQRTKCIDKDTGIHIKPRKSAIVYFHNAKYDFAVMKPFLENISSICQKDGAFYSAKMKYFGTNIEIRDSYKIITQGIKKMPAMFKLDPYYHKNEAIAYAYHTVERINNTMCSLEEYKSFLNPELHETFEKILYNNEVECDYDHEKQTFNPFMYYKKYGELDVEILKQSMKIFNNQLKVLFPTKNLDIKDCLTISKLALSSVSDCIQDIQTVTGNLRKFMSNAVYGGRVYSNPQYTKKVINKEISDFDACSMYPSAMIRISNEFGFPTQKWEHTLPSDWNRIFNSKEHYYIVKIKLLSIGKKIQIPTVCVKTNDGSDYLNEIPKQDTFLTVDKVTLEDMIKFQHITYEFVESCHVSLKDSNKQLGKMIMDLYCQRLKVKKENPPLAELIKLILNSIYGKTIPKVTQEKTDIVYEENLDKYTWKNFHKISDIEQMNDNTYIVKSFKPDQSSIYSVIGIMTLSMSKRIMNEVFNICDDFEYPIYYTDTDSMHIDKKDIPNIEKEYKIRYNKDLIGNMPEQFHSDFKLIGSDGKAIEPDNVISTKSIFLGKKCYIDSLEGTDSNGNLCKGLHYRMKGISESGLVNHANKNYEGDILKLYESLSNGNNEEIVLNYDEYHQSFEHTNYGVQFRELNSFSRTIKF